MISNLPAQSVLSTPVRVNPSSVQKGRGQQAALRKPHEHPQAKFGQAHKANTGFKNLFWTGLASLSLALASCATNISTPPVSAAIPSGQTINALLSGLNTSEEITYRQYHTVGHQTVRVNNQNHQFYVIQNTDPNSNYHLNPAGECSVFEENGFECLAYFNVEMDAATAAKAAIKQFNLNPQSAIVVIEDHNGMASSIAYKK